MFNPKELEGKSFIHPGLISTLEKLRSGKRPQKDRQPYLELELEEERHEQDETKEKPITITIDI